MDPLSRLALCHDTDKWGSHFYTEAYHRHLARFRLRPVRLLELGVGGYRNPDEGGGSLRLWKAYLPQGDIVGIDVFEKPGLSEERITVVRGSQGDAAFLAATSDEYGPFDIVIDDGSHVQSDVLASFDTLFPLLEQGGIYVIEDTQTSYWPDFGGSPDLENPSTVMARMKSLADRLNHAEIRVIQPDRQPDAVALAVVGVTFYHNMVFVEKGDNTAASNFAPGPDTRQLLRALRIVQRAISAGGCRAALHARQAQLLFQLGRVDDAARQQAKAVTLEPEIPRQHGRLARLLAEQGRWTEAAASYRSALALSPANPVYAAELADCLAKGAADNNECLMDGSQ